MPKAAPGPEVLETFSLRMPMPLRRRLHRAAIANRRSLNSEIIILLERALPAETKEADAAPTASASE